VDVTEGQVELQRQRKQREPAPDPLLALNQLMTKLPPA
jgi:hypothetical protein